MQGEGNMVTAHWGSRNRSFTPTLLELIIDASMIVITVHSDLFCLMTKNSEIFVNSGPQSSTDLE